MANSRAIFLMIAAMAFFAVSDACIKFAARSIETGQIMLTSALCSLVFFLPLLRREATPLFSRDLFQWAMVLRTFGEVTGSIGIVVALSLIPLSTVTAVTQAQPLVMTLAAAVFLRERVGWRRWMAVGLGFLGMMVVLRPGAASFDPATLWLVVAILGLTTRDVGTRLLPPAMSTAFVSVWAMIGIGAAGAVVMMLQGGWQPMTPAVWGWSAGIGLAVALAFLTITASLRAGEISAVAPFRYSRVVFAFLFAYLVFGERPDLATWAGMGLIVCSGLYAFWRERRVQTVRPDACE